MMEGKLPVQESKYVVCCLFIIGIIFFIAGLIFSLPLNGETLGVNSEKLGLVVKLELTVMGFLLVAFGILVVSKKLSLSEVKYLGLLFIPVLFFLGFGFWRIWVCDDAFHTFRVVRNLLSGHGPVYNVGERVEVYSHPLWLGILAFWDYVTGKIELGAAWLGLLFSASGLFLGQLGARTFVRKSSNYQKLAFIPLGSIVIAALLPFWDYASSGLETGLGFFWLGLSFFLLARQSSETSWWTVRCMLAWFSLGPLIRPDFVVFSGGLILLSLAIRPPKSIGDSVYFGIAALSLPSIYQVFRIGYFASLYPNTALAKSALSSYWSQGLIYLQDFVSPYKLYIPVYLLVVALIIEALYVFKARSRCQGARIAVVIMSLGALHAFFVFRGGGDFMHGRYLLPSFFALQLPVSCIAFPINNKFRRIMIPILIGTVIWASWCIGWGRIPYGGIGPHSIADERGVYVRVTGQPNPITLSDYGMSKISQSEWAAQAKEAINKELSNRSVTTNFGGGRAFAAGPSGYSYAGAGLSSPIGSRFSLKFRLRPGHEKEVPETWKLARFGNPTRQDHTIESVLRKPHSLEVRTLLARKVLDCSPVSDLLEAIHRPLTFSRFWHNMSLAWQTPNLKIPRDSSEAIRKFCSPVSPEVESMLSLDPGERLLTLGKANESAESSCKVIVTNLSNYCRNNLGFEFRPFPEHNSVTVTLLVEGQERKDYTLTYVFPDGKDLSEKGDPIIQGTQATLFLEQASTADNYYHFSCDLEKELKRFFGQQARFHRLSLITFKSSSKYLQFKAFSFYGKPVTKNFNGLTLEDHLDVGNPWWKEEKHDYTIKGQTSEGTIEFTYPNGVILRDDWRAFTGYEQFTIRANPERDLLILKRIDYGIGDQVVDVYVLPSEGIKEHVGRWTVAGKDLENRWREVSFTIPAKYIRSKHVTLRFSYVSSDVDINSFFYWFYSKN